jgi:hypothetical protein
MPWFKIDDGFANSKAVLRIPRRFRTNAIGLWTLAGTWSAKELTDGYVPDYLIEELASTPAIAGQLVKAGLWETADNGWSFVGWRKYQPTREQVLAEREREAERKRKYRESKRSPKGVPAGQTEGHQAESEHPDPTRPDPTRPLLVKDLGSEGYVEHRAGEAPSPKCRQHINEPNPPNCRACGDARASRKRWDAEQERAAAEAARAERERDAEMARRQIAACDMCDDTGYRGLRPCDHNPDQDEINNRGREEAWAAIGGRP